MSEQRRAAIVTGAAGGIGQELVLGLLGKGLKVAAVDRTAQGLAELAQAAQERQHGANLMTIEADLARDEAIDEIVAKARGRFGAIDILVNNAGVGQATIRSDNRQQPDQVLGGDPRAVEALCRGPQQCADGAVARPRPRHDAPEMGPHRQYHDEPRHDDPRGLADLRPVEGGIGSLFGDHGEGPRRHRRHPPGAIPLLGTPGTMPPGAHF